MPPLDRDELTAQVREVLVETLRLDASPGLDDRLVEDLGAESVDLIGMVFELEDKLGREISDQDRLKMTTVRAIVDLLASGPDGESGAR
jgi:acyl carrier protein